MDWRGGKPSGPDAGSERPPPTGSTLCAGGPHPPKGLRRPTAHRSRVSRPACSSSDSAPHTLSSGRSPGARALALCSSTPRLNVPSPAPMGASSVPHQPRGQIAHTCSPPSPSDNPRSAFLEAGLQRKEGICKSDETFCTFPPHANPSSQTFLGWAHSP